MSQELQPNKSMGWDLIAQLILQYGLPFALSLAEKWSSGAPVTLEEIAKLREMAGQTARDVMIARLLAAGIPLESPQAKALLDLLPVMPPPLAGP